MNIDFASLNNYATFEYDKNFSVLDAAFALVTIFPENAFSFILYVYSKILNELKNDYGIGYNGNSNMYLNLIGKENDARLFLYNLIYMYDNNEDSFDDYFNVYNSNSFNEIIEKYISYCNIENYQNGVINNYIREIEDYVEGTYMNREIILKNLNAGSNVEKWKMYVFVAVYYFLDLFNSIKQGRTSGPFILLKAFLNSTIICQQLFKFLSMRLDNKGALINSLPPQIKSIFNGAMKFYFGPPSNGVLSQKYGAVINYSENYDFFLKFFSIEDKSLQKITDRFDKYYTQNELYAYLKQIAISNGTQPGIFFERLREIITEISELQIGNSSEYDFYNNFITSASKGQINANGILTEISNSAEDGLFTEYINMFFLLSFEPEEDNYQDLTNNSFNNLIDEINNIYKNLCLEDVIQNIIYDPEKKENAEEFYAQQIDLFRKKYLPQQPRSEHDSECNTICLPTFLKVDVDYESFPTSSFNIGNSTFGVESPPPVELI